MSHYTGGRYSWENHFLQQLPLAVVVRNGFPMSTYLDFS